LFGLTRPPLLNVGSTCVDNTTGATTINAPGAGCAAGQTLASNGFREFFFGNSPRPRISVGFGVNWNSPFGPFRIDVAKALIKAQGDDTKLLTFNVGTAF
jgi:outer membrane protein insertion porin family